MKKPSHNLEWDRSEGPPVGTYNPRRQSKIMGLADFARQSMNRAEFYERRAKAMSYELAQKPDSAHHRKLPALAKLHLEENLSDSQRKHEYSSSVRSEGKKSSIKLKKLVDRFSTLNPHGYVDLHRQAARRYLDTKSFDQEGRRFASIPALVSRYAMLTQKRASRRHRAYFGQSAFPGHQEEQVWQGVL